MAPADGPSSSSATAGEPLRKLPRTRYPRRRAVTACRVCRERKKKCDNQRPVCSSCQLLGADCEYGTAHDEASYDAASLAILGRLSTIESLLRRQDRPSRSSRSESDSPGVDDHQQQQLDEPFSGSVPAPNNTQPTSSPLASIDTANSWPVDGGANFKLRADKVLQWPVFDRPLAALRRSPLVTFLQESDFTYLGETAATSLPAAAAAADVASSLPPAAASTEAADIEPLVERFFARVHIKNPFLDRRLVAECCREYCEHGPLFTLRACLVLLICALGCVTPTFEPADRTCLGASDAARLSERAAGLRLGCAYYAAAEKRLGAAMTKSSSLAVQCLCLAGIYHMSTLNPMAAQAMFHSAGFKLQTLVSTGADRLEGTSQIGSSLFWACYKSERELFAELPLALPALNRPDQASGYPLPPQERFILADPEAWTPSDEDSWYFFLSEIALRRIKDKIAEVVAAFFDTITPASPAAVTTAALDELAPVVAELRRQVLAWREHLPPRVRFDDVPRADESELSLHLRGPFFMQLEAMHRPFVFAALHLPAPSPMVRSMAAAGMVYTCVYLRSGHPTLVHHGRWLQLRYELVAMSTMTASAAAGIDMPPGWRDVVALKLRSFEYWRTEAPSCQMHVDVVRALQDYFGEGAGDWADTPHE